MQKNDVVGFHSLPQKHLRAGAARVHSRRSQKSSLINLGFITAKNGQKNHLIYQCNHEYDVKGTWFTVTICNSIWFTLKFNTQTEIQKIGGLTQSKDKKKKSKIKRMFPFHLHSPLSHFKLFFFLLLFHKSNLTVLHEVELCFCSKHCERASAQAHPQTHTPTNRQTSRLYLQTVWRRDKAASNAQHSIDFHANQSHPIKKGHAVQK